MIAATGTERLEWIYADLRYANAARRAARMGLAITDEAGERARCCECALVAISGGASTLAVYGSLRRGAPNHHEISGIDGAWTVGYFEGDLHPVGWGASLGFPAAVWRPGALALRCDLLTTAALASDWPRLDAFEGDGYVRVLVPVFSAPPADGGELCAIANLYEPFSRG